jgi:hypothetical protein
MGLTPPMEIPSHNVNTYANRGMKETGFGSKVVVAKPTT